MNSKLKTLWIAAAATLVALPSLRAEDVQGMFVGGAVTVANDSLKKVTGKTYGVNLNIGLDRTIADTNIGFRPAFGVTWLPGKVVADGSKTSLTNLQISTDLIVPTGIDRLHLVTGISLNLWRYLASPATGTGENPWGLDGSKAPNKLKFGFRGGLDVKITEKWTAEVLLQMVEFGSPTADVNWKNINPTWIQAGVKYHF